MDKQDVQNIFSESARLIDQCAADYADEIVAAGNRLLECFEQGGKVLICGNGGSASQAQHFAAELVNKLAIYRKALPALSLATDTATLTSIGNDLDFESIFARQVAALGRPGDVLWGLSTSGRSANVIMACDTAHKLGMHTVCFLGQAHSPLAEMADCALTVPASNTARVQEVHLCYGHLVCQMIEEHYLQEQEQGGE